MFESGLDNELLTLDTGLENSAMAAEEQQAGTYWVITSRAKGDANNPFGGSAEANQTSQLVQMTEQQLRQEYQDSGQLQNQFGSFDNYLGYVGESQEWIQTADWMLATPEYRTGSKEWAFLNGEDLAWGPGEREQIQQQINQDIKNARTSGYQNWMNSEQGQALMQKYGIQDTIYNDDGDQFKWTGSGYQKTIKIDDHASFADYATAVLKSVVISLVTGAATQAALGAFNVTGSDLLAKLPSGVKDFIRSNEILRGAVGAIADQLPGILAGGAAGGGSLNEQINGMFDSTWNNVIVNLAGSDYDPDNPDNVQNPDELQNPDQDDLLDRLILTAKTITGIDSPLYEDPDNPGNYYYEDGTVAVQPDPNQPAYNTFYNPDGTEYGYGKTSDYGLIPAAPPESVKDLADPSILDNSTYVIYNPQTGEWIDTTIAGRDGKPTSWGDIGNDSYWVVRGADGSLYVTDGTDLEPYRGGISDDPLMNDGVEDEFRGRHPLWQHVKNGGDLPGGGEITNGGAVVVPPKDDTETDPEDTTNVADTESTSPGGGNSTSDSNTGDGGDAGTSGGDATSDSDGTNQTPSDGEVVTADGTGDPVGGEGEQGGEQPAEGDPCKTADGRTGTVKNGVCVFEPSIITVNPSVWAGDDNTTGGVTDDNNAGGDNNNNAGGDNPTVTDNATPGSTNDGNVPGVITVGPSVWGTGASGDGNTGTGNGNGDGNGDGSGDGDGGNGGDGGEGAGRIVAGAGGSNTQWLPLYPGSKFRRFDKRARQGMMSQMSQPNFSQDSRQNLYAGMFSDLMKGKA